jgi:aconitate hydratase
MAPEYGATCGFFPIDEETIKYLNFSGRDKDTVSLVETYAKEQNLWSTNDLLFSDTISLDLSKVVPSISGPKKPQNKVLLSDAANDFKKVFKENTKRDSNKETQS